MNVDELVVAAGRRAANLEVTVPDSRAVIAHHARRRSWFALTTMALPLVLVTSVALVVLRGSVDDQEVATGPSVSGMPTVDLEVTGDTRLHITTSPLAPGQGGAWLVHEVTIQNLGDETLTPFDHRESAFLGDREVLVADPGCGWAGGTGGQQVQPGLCQLYNREVVRPVGPGESTSFTITLWRDLPGMNAVRDELLERVKTVEMLMAGQRTTVELQFTYRGLPHG